ncbi:MAG TPA: hypothetical protein DEP42_01570 [Ruminococcaceae bacterium]|nr:hypothetical protein [Oscillospiraceae bacterium]
MAAISFTSIFDIINIPLGFALRFCYQITMNYGLAILLFTIIIRLILFPLAIKQQKVMANSLRLQPKLKALQKKYAKDKQKLGEEQMKLYQEEGASPMGGCLPLVVQLPIIWGLYNVIYHPLLYISQIGQGTLNKVVQHLWPIIQHSDPTFAKMSSYTQALNNRELEILVAKILPSHMSQVPFVPHDTLQMNFNFFGLDLSTMPGYRFSIYLLIPILCYVSTFVQIFLTNRINKRNNIAANAPGTGGMNIGMLVIMPLFSSWISFSFPSGVGIYWITSNVFMLFQTLFLNKLYNPKKLAEQFEQASVEKKKARMRKLAERQAQLAVQQAEENGEDPEQIRAAEEEKLEEDSFLNEEDEKASNRKMMLENRKRLAASRKQSQARQQSKNSSKNKSKKKKRRR